MNVPSNPFEILVFTEMTQVVGLPAGSWVIQKIRHSAKIQGYSDQPLLDQMSELWCRGYRFDVEALAWLLILEGGDGQSPFRYKRISEGIGSNQGHRNPFNPFLKQVRWYQELHGLFALLGVIEHQRIHEFLDERRYRLTDQAIWFRS